MKYVFRIFLLASVAAFLLILVVGYVKIWDYDDEFDRQFVDDYWQQENNDFLHVHGTGDSEEAQVQSIKHPIIIWWTPFTREIGQTKTCGDVKCFFTVDRHYHHHEQTKVFMFYGSDMYPEDLPLPRKPTDEWALLHEESPKNEYLFSHQEVMALFNHTATFKRESDFPLTLQYLDKIEDLEGREYMVPTAEKNRRLSELALVNFVSSDCTAPSDRDHLVQMIQKHIKVDSYGDCLHNKDLPKHLRDPVEGMDHADFYKLMAQYKFTLAFENGICDDYITEKIWRPLRLGSVPIILGSPKIRDYLPSEKSAILVEDFESVEDLVKFILFLNSSDAHYEQYLNFKNPQGVTNQRLRREVRDRVYTINDDNWDDPNFIDTFECFVCKRIHQNIDRTSRGEPEIRHQAKEVHYGCPKPKRFQGGQGRGNLKRVEDEKWAELWTQAKYQAIALRELIGAGLPYSRIDILKRGYQIFKQESRKKKKPS